MRKVLVAIGSVVVIGFAALVVWVLATALTSEHRVGFQTVMVADPNGPPIEVGIWYPTDARPWPKLAGLIVQWVAGDAPVKGDHHPLIVISHGIAGALSSHADTALALADAGFVVAAPLHTGDNYRDQSAIGTTGWFPNRVRHVHLTINYMLEQWRARGRVDADKIGVFGFSAGGTTALIAAGGMPDFELVKQHCAKVQEFACDVWHKTNAAPPDWRDFLHDPRIKSAVVIAPGAGFAFAQYGLANVRVPVQLWGGERDESVPTPSNAEVVHRELGKRAEWHLVPKAGHFSFMVPCGPASLIAPKLICKDPAGFDRAAFHKTFNRHVVAFFQKTLASAPSQFCIRGKPSVCVPHARAPSVFLTGTAGEFDAFGRKVPRSGIFSLSENAEFKLMVDHGDYITEFSRNGLDKACTSQACIYYRKQCDLDGPNCVYLFFTLVRVDGVDRLLNGTALFLSARNQAALARLEDEITVAQDDSLRERIPLKAMTQAYPMGRRIPDISGLTQCSERTQTPGCARPFLDGRGKPTAVGLKSGPLEHHLG